MIKSQTLQITLPTNEKVEKEQQNQAKKSEAVTLILDTEYDQNGKPSVDAESGKTIHYVYWYQGMPDTTFQTNLIARERFIGDTKENGVKVQQGIRKILRQNNKEVMEEYTKLKEQWKNREISKETFDSLAKKNASDSLKTRPVVIIKPSPNTTYEALINALDEMQINQISRYNIQLPTHTDTLLLENFEKRTGQRVIKPNIRTGAVY